MVCVGLLPLRGRGPVSYCCHFHGPISASPSLPRCKLARKNSVECDGSNFGVGTRERYVYLSGCGFGTKFFCLVEFSALFSYCCYFYGPILAILRCHVVASPVEMVLSTAKRQKRLFKIVVIAWLPLRGRRPICTVALSMAKFR